MATISPKRSIPWSISISIQENIFVQENIQFLPLSWVHSIISVWSFPNCSFNFSFQVIAGEIQNLDIVLQADFQFRLPIWTMFKDNFAGLRQGFTKG